MMIESKLNQAVQYLQLANKLIDETAFYFAEGLCPTSQLLTKSFNSSSASISIVANSLLRNKNFIVENIRSIEFPVEDSDYERC